MNVSFALVVAVDPVHGARIDKDQHDEDIDGALLGEPESQRKAAGVQCVQRLDEDDRQAEGHDGPDDEQRSHDHDDVLDIVSRQTALNFEPGHEYSYSNTGFNLLAVVVSRVSGIPFADFSKQHDEAKIIGILQKTWAKMTAEGQGAALKLDMPAEARALVEKALGA